MSEIKQVEVLIAGQGAAAFAAGLYAARYQMSILIAGELFGGETAIGGLIENYPGQPDIDGFDLMMKFKDQIDFVVKYQYRDSETFIHKKSNKENKC